MVGRPMNRVGRYPTNLKRGNQPMARLAASHQMTSMEQEQLPVRMYVGANEQRLVETPRNA